MRPQPHTDRHMWFTQANVVSAFSIWASFDFFNRGQDLTEYFQRCTSACVVARTFGVGQMDAVGLVCMGSYSFVLCSNASACLIVIQRKCLKHAKVAGILCSPCKVVCTACTKASNAYSYVCCVRASLRQFTPLTRTWCKAAVSYCHELLENHAILFHNVQQCLAWSTQLLSSVVSPRTASQACIDEQA